MDINQLHNLYQEGRYEECLKELEIHLIINPTDVEAWLLKATCYHEFLLQQHEVVDFTQLQPVFESYHTVLKLNPDHDWALVELLNLESHFMTEVDIASFAQKVDKLLASNDEVVQKQGLLFRSIEQSHNKAYQKALETLEQLIEKQQSVYLNNRNQKDIEVANSVWRQYNLLRYNLQQPQSALKLMHKYIGAFTSATAYLFIDIARFALVHKDYTLTGIAGEKALMTDLENPDEIDAVLDLYHEVLPIIDEGCLDKSLIGFVLMTQKSFGERLNLDVTDLVSSAKRFIPKFETWSLPYHYTASFIFEAGGYNEALPHFEKALQYGGGYATTVYRYILCYYYVNQQIIVPENWPDYNPRDYYNLGVAFEDFENEVSTPLISNDLVAVRAAFYRKAFQGLVSYFKNNEYDSDYYTTPHLVAMCSNNYAIALSDQQEYDLATEVIQEGLSRSDFWEMHYTLANAYFYMQHYMSALDAYDNVLSYDIAYSSPESYYKVLSRKVTCLYHTHQIGEAQLLYKKLKDEFNADLSAQNEMSTREFNQVKLEIQNALYAITSHLSVEDMIEVWKKEVADDPDNESNWFMLMQHYYSLPDYANAIACANHYEALKPANEMALFSYLKLHFMRGVSFCRMGNYQNAITNLEEVLSGYEKGEPTSDDYSSIADTHQFLGEAYEAIGNKAKTLEHTQRAMDIYVLRDWWKDEEWLAGALRYGRAVTEVDKAKAKAIYKTILSFFPDNEEALGARKELSIRKWF